MSKVMKLFGITIFVWTLFMIATVRFSFHFITTTLNINPTITTVYNLNTTTSIKSNTNTSIESNINTITTIWDIEQCWSYLFTTQFVEPNLSHQFTNPNIFTSYTNSFLSICNTNNIQSLLIETYTTLKSTTPMHKFTFHDLISLRRTLMILGYKSNILSNSNRKYIRILKLISKMESKFISQKRYEYPIFNIHLPRSAGTTICSHFQLSQWYQQANIFEFPNGSYSLKLMDKDTIKRPILTNSKYGTNCNIGDGFPFNQYLINSHSPKTCDEQYIQSENYTMFARESPLYNNNNNDKSHPELCNKFLYVLTVRSPIE
eukprot:6252_1